MTRKFRTDSPPARIKIENGMVKIQFTSPHQCTLEGLEKLAQQTSRLMESITAFNHTWTEETQQELGFSVKSTSAPITVVFAQEPDKAEAVRIEKAAEMLRRFGATTTIEISAEKHRQLMKPPPEQPPPSYTSP